MYEVFRSQQVRPFVPLDDRDEATTKRQKQQFTEEDDLFGGVEF